MKNNDQFDVDICILGGGIAGLWTLNILRQQGYHAVLLECDRLGGRQTGLSQGIIHGGIKYTLTGKLTDSALSISDMPQYWRQCLEGAGTVDLRKTNVLSNYHYLWSNSRLAGKVGNFLLKKTLKSHAESISSSDYPPLFQHPDFNGKILKVAETVLDVPSLVSCLAEQNSDHIYKANSEVNISENAIASIGAPQTLRAQHYIFSAGEQNALLLRGLHQAPAMQRRPLHMAILKPPVEAATYAHCLGASNTPRVTITSHYNSQGDLLWYLGGGVAETGVNRDAATQQQFVRDELNDLLPWLDFSNVAVETFFIDRAEGYQPDGKRPKSFCLEHRNNYSVAWPTKLALTPLLANEIQKHLQTIGLKPLSKPHWHAPEWPKPNTIHNLWDQFL